MKMHENTVYLNPLAGVETKHLFVDLLVFLVLLGFLGFPENQET